MSDNHSEVVLNQVDLPPKDIVSNRSIPLPTGPDRMPKKANWGVNEKVVEARERKENAKKTAQDQEERAKEDAYWRSHGDGEKSKAQAKKEEQERQRQEALAKKAEAKRLADEEAARMSQNKPTKKEPRVAVAKVTQYQLQQQKEFEEKQRQEETKEMQLARKREVSSDAYERMVSMENTNRDEDSVSAVTVEQALSALAVSEAAPQDKHPEKRMRAAWLAFEARELPRLMEEKPNLKKAQYRDLLWKIWQKSPENPMNQQPAKGPAGR